MTTTESLSESDFFEVPATQEHEEEEDQSVFEIHDFSTASDWEK